MAETIVFDESEVEPILGTAPSPYDKVIVFTEDEVEPIVGTRPSPYDKTVGSYEQKVLAEPAIPAEPESEGTPEAFDPAALITARRGYWGRFDVDGFAGDVADLLREPGGAQRATDTLKSLQIYNDVGNPVPLDDVATAVASHASADLPRLGGTSEGQYLALDLIRLLQTGVTSEVENATVARLVRTALPDHDVLEQARWLEDRDLAAALAREGAKFQPLTDGGGEVVYDQYSVVADKLPPGTTVGSLVREMTEDLNRTVDNRTFDRINVFQRRPSNGPPAIGDIYDIDIAGPENGSVVMVRKSASAFTFQTIDSGPETGSHPEYGVREFGFRRLPEGGTQFYTRGVSRPQNSLLGAVGGVIQRAGWQSLIDGVAATITRRGGRVRPGSVRGESTAN